MADFLLKQHLKLSKNAEIKNLKPEIIQGELPPEEWKKGRIWFNSLIGKLQTIYPKMDTETGTVLEPEELEIVTLGEPKELVLGIPSDGEFYPDGLLNFNESTKINDAVDEVNEALKDLAPSQATPLQGDLNPDIAFLTGKISSNIENSPDVLNIGELIPGTTINYITNKDSFKADLPTEGLFVKDTLQQQFGMADQGNIELLIDGETVDNGVDLGQNFTESSRGIYGSLQGFDHPITQTFIDEYGDEFSLEVNPAKENYKSDKDFIIISSVERYNDFKKWQKGSGYIQIGKTNNQNKVGGGFHTYQVVHKINDRRFETNKMKLFYDLDKTEVLTTITDFSLLSGDVKYVSGVPYYFDNISFKLSLEVQNAFKYTYWDQPILANGSNITSGYISWDDETSSLKDKTVPAYDDLLVITDKELAFNNNNTVQDTVSVSVKAGKVSTSWGNTETASLPILINTKLQNLSATDTFEPFVDETKRLSKDILFDDVNDILAGIGMWDSNALLELGEAQQILGNLEFAHEDFSGFINVDTDYSTLGDTEQVYYRAIRAEGKPNSNGKLEIITDDILGTDFEVHIKIPSITGWLDINKSFDVQDYSMNFDKDGTGCMVSTQKIYNRYNIDWSIGTHSTADSSFLYVIRITLKNKTVSIESIEEKGNGWQ